MKSLTPMFQCACSAPNTSLEHWFFGSRFPLICSLFERTAKILTRLCRCAGSPKPLMFAYAIIAIFLHHSSTVKLISHRITAKIIVPYKLLVQLVDLNAPYQSLNTAICSTDLEEFTNHRTCFYYT